MVSGVELHTQQNIDALIELSALESKHREHAGTKASNMARLARGGLPIPPGYVLFGHHLDQILRANAVPQTLAKKLLQCVIALGTPVIVRSSANFEDRPQGGAPGLLCSVRDVHPDNLLAAIVTVAGSANRPYVKRYLGHQVVLPVPVIVQKQQNGIRGTLYTRAPGDADSQFIVVEIHKGTSYLNAHLWRDSLECDRVDFGFPLPKHKLTTLAKLAMQCEQEIDSIGGLDIEWVCDADAIWLVQARPIVTRIQTATVLSPDPEMFEFSKATPETTWYWDAAHNPIPLSPAQAGLVEHIDRVGIAPYQMRVVGGYLYATRPEPPDREEIRQEDLGNLFHNRICPALEDALSPLEQWPPVALPAALVAYENVFYWYATELGSILSQAKHQLLTLLAAHLHGPAITNTNLFVSASPYTGSWIKRAAKGEISVTELEIAIGSFAPIWDVATPTYAETPDLIRSVVDGYVIQNTPTPPTNPGPIAKTRSLLPQHIQTDFDRMLATAMLAAEIGELDDVFFARSQAGLRRSLFATADAVGLMDPDDIFFVPLPVALNIDGTGSRMFELHEIAKLAREKQQYQSTISMPISFRDGAIQNGMPATFGQLQGLPSQGRVIGTIFRMEDPTVINIPENAILLYRTITPASLFTMPRPLALITEFGGLLDHATALARELGIPSVVGCRGTWNTLQNGDRVLVDADSGTVIKLDQQVPETAPR